MLISRANQKNRFRRHDAKFNVSIQKAGRGYSFLRAEFGFNLWRRTHGRGARTMPVRTPAHSGARPPRRAAIRRRAAPRPASRPHAIALHSDARCRGACVKSARGGAGYGGEDRDCCRPPAPSSHRQPLGRARRPHRATSERATPDPTPKNYVQC